MKKEEYYVLVCPGYGVGVSEFDVDYLLTKNTIKRFRDIPEKNSCDKVYRREIVPEAVPHAVRTLKERRFSYSGLFSRNAENFYLCFEAWARFQSPTGEARRLSDPERVKAKEREIKQYSKASLKRLDEMYSALKKADVETLNSVPLIQVSIWNTTGEKKPQKELIFTQGGIWFLSADELRGYTREEQQAFLSGLIDDPDQLPEIVKSAVDDAERPFLLLDDGGEGTATGTGEIVPAQAVAKEQTLTSGGEDRMGAAEETVVVLSENISEQDRKIFDRMLEYDFEIVDYKDKGTLPEHFKRTEPSFHGQAGPPLMKKEKNGYQIKLGKAGKQRHWIKLDGKGRTKPYWEPKSEYKEQWL